MGTRLNRFNPRAREGRDLLLFRIYNLCVRFNPRAREGRDAELSQAWSSKSSFNPRAREGRDLWANSPRQSFIQVSIHAPVKGATPLLLVVPFVFLVSIHAPVKGATSCGICQPIY